LHDCLDWTNYADGVFHLLTHQLRQVKEWLA